MVRAAASGDRDLAKKVASFHSRMERMIVDALRGAEGKLDRDALPDEAEARLAYHLNLVWFALLVGWSGGLYSQGEVIEQMGNVTATLFRGSDM